MADVLSFVEFENAADLKMAVEKLDNTEFKGANVHCIADVGMPIARRIALTRSRSKNLLVIAIARARRVRAMASAHQGKNTMVVADRLHAEGTALVAMTIAAAPRRAVTITTHETIVTIRLLVVAALRWKMDIRHLGEATVMILTPHHHHVDTRNPTPMATSVLHDREALHRVATAPTKAIVLATGRYLFLIRASRLRVPRLSLQIHLSPSTSSSDKLSGHGERGCGCLDTCGPCVTGRCGALFSCS